MIIARSRAQRHAARARVAPPLQRPRHAIALGRAKQLRWARTRASQSSGRTPAIDIARLSSCATRPPAFLRRLHPETSRHREPGSLEINAAPSDRRITTRRRLAGDVRRTRGRRPSARGAVPASVPGAISAQVPPSSPPAATRDQHDSPATAHSTPLAHHPKRTHHNGRAAALERGQDDPPHAIYFVTNLFEPRDTNPQYAGACPAGRHAGAASVGPAAARARPVRMLQNARARGCARACAVRSRACPTP